MTRSRTPCLVTLFLSLAASVPAAADDWPAWRGPNRDAICRETGLLKKWPDGGPKLLWKKRGLGEGYSGPAIVGNMLYTMGNKDGREWVLALDVDKEAKQLWATDIGPVEYAGYCPGTRSTPSIDGDRLYALGATGQLVCLDRKSGKPIWSKSYIKDFGGVLPTWAFAESVLIDGDWLLCTPGGTEATVAALDKMTGKTIWAARLGDKASYSSIIVGTAGEVKQYVAFTADRVVGLAARDGKLLWDYKEPAHSADWGDVNVMTPVWSGGAVFAASNYGVGGGRADVSPTADGFTAKQRYFTKKMKNHHGGVILLDGHLYGCNDPGILTCLNFETGEVVWEHRKPGKCSLLYADGRLYCRDEKGPISLVEATPDGFKLHGRFEQPDRSDQRSWPHLVIAHGRLFVRDQDLLLCYEVKSGE